MNKANLRVRILLLLVFLFFTLPCLTYLALAFPGLRALLMVDMGLRAIPLFAAVQIDQVFLDGGELTPDLIPIWVLFTGLLLWPLLVLGIRPTLWSIRRWRRAVAAYSACAFAVTVVAAGWVFTHMGYFF
ncbi:MAG: hypothetical protein KJ060_03280 [Candidatus Hydrogenedentes bacterium]|nr:hypothetical protein [Candidatus Hydrogenedentota bacterium]